MQLLTFTLGNVKFGVPIQDVRSIEQKIQTVEIPNSLPYIKGIMNLHDRIIPVYSLNRKFNYPEEEIQNIIVSDVGGMQIGFEVCKVQEILEVAEDHVAPMPEIISDTQKYIPDVANYDHNLIALLDVKTLINQEEKNDIQKLLEEQGE